VVAVRHHLLLPAAGSGRRMGHEFPKQYLEIAGRTVLQHTLERLGALERIDSIMLVLSVDDPWWSTVESRLSAPVRAKLRCAAGGAERCDSVFNGLQALKAVAQPDDFVLVHDSVRPCVRIADVLRLLEAVAHEPAGGLLATPVRDTLKLATADAHVERTVDRTMLWSAATPQVFRYRILHEALVKMAAVGRKVTDEAEAVEALGHPVRLVQGSADNIKLTYADDLQLAELILGAND